MTEEKVGRLPADSGHRATDAPHEAPAGLRPGGSVSTGAGDLPELLFTVSLEFMERMPPAAFALMQDAALALGYRRGDAATYAEMLAEQGVWADGCSILTCGPLTGHTVRGIAFCDRPETAQALASGIVAATAGETRQGIDERSEQSPVREAETPK